MMTPEAKQGRKSRQIITESRYGQKIWDQISWQHEIGQCRKHGEPHLGGGLIVQQEFDPFNDGHR